MGNEIGYFKLLNIYGGLCVPNHKPNIAEILNIEATAEILEKKLIKTTYPPIIGISLEGQMRTNYKLVVDGDIYYNVKYLPTNKKQGIHSLQITIPFCNYITLPEHINYQSMVEASIVIEDIYIDNFDERYSYINVTLMLIADIY